MSRKKAVWAVIAIVAVLLVVSCAPAGAEPRGWSGAVISDGTAVVVTMEGKLAVIDIASRSRARADIPVEAPAPAAGGFGCGAPQARAVAIYGTPAVSGNVAYVGGYDGRLHALTFGPDGSEMWHYPAEGTLKPIAGGIALSPGVAYFGSSDGILYAVNLTGHDLKWKFPTGDKIWSTPVVDGNTVYIGSFDRKLYAVNIADGSKKWEFATGGAITGMPLVYRNTVYVGSFDRHVYAIDAATGNLKWKSSVQAEKWFWAGPVVANEAIYAASLDGKVYAFSSVDGNRVAELDLKSPVSSQPVVMENAIVVASQEGKVYSIFRNNELRSLVTVDEVYAPLAVSQGTVFVHSMKNEALYAINAQTGVKLWSLLLGSK